MTLLRFTRGTGFGGAFVRFTTFSDFAHVGFKLDDGTVLDACPGLGVSIRQADDDETTEYWDVAAPKATIAEAVDWAKTQIGKRYDWLSIAGLFIRRDWHKNNAWDCSEFVTAAFDYVHWPLIRDSGKYDRITPRDLMMSTRIRPALPSEMPR